MDVPYYEVYEGNWCSRWKLLRPTGKWKLESGQYGKDELYIQHKGLIFKSWIHESDIDFRPAKSVKVFYCEDNQ